MKKKLIFAMSTAILAAGLSFGVSYEAQATKDTCNGRKVFGDGDYANPECRRIGSGCPRSCGFLEFN
jgi:alpha-L-fucosidase